MHAYYFHKKSIGIYIYCSLYSILSMRVSYMGLMTIIINERRRRKRKDKKIKKCTIK